MQEYWRKQGSDPLFSDLLWSRPENKTQAGKLLIIGGTAQGFSRTAESFAAANEAGVGNIRTILPSALRKTVSAIFPSAQFAPSTPSGSFALSALAELLDNASWSDGVLLVGDTGYNSETTQLFESFVSSYKDRLTVSRDIMSTFMNQPLLLLERPNTTLVMTLAELQKLASATKYTSAFTSEMGITELVKKLHDFSQPYPANMVIRYEQTLVVSSEGFISTTPHKDTPELTPMSAKIATWWLQNQTQPYKALTTAVF